MIPRDHRYHPLATRQFICIIDDPPGVGDATETIAKKVHALETERPWKRRHGWHRKPSRGWGWR